MNHLLYPQIYIPSVYDIPYEFLFSKGYKGILFDIDNTLAPYVVPVPPKSIQTLLSYVIELGFSVMLVSNNSSTRVTEFVRELSVHGLSRAAKPMTSKINKAVTSMNLAPEETIFVGDQIFTDVLCANLLGMYPILVTPLSHTDEWTVRPKRKLEQFFVKKYMKQSHKISLALHTTTPISTEERKDNLYE